MPDPGLTRRLAGLFEMPHPAREAAWHQAFFDAVWNAGLAIGDPPMFQGPDGFSYLRLQIPADTGTFEPTTLAARAGELVQGSFGAAIFTSAEMCEPDSLLPTGLLDALLRYDDWRGDPFDLTEIEAGADEARAPFLVEHVRDLRIGVPRVSFLPLYTARALHRHLTENWGVAAPRVAIAVDSGRAPSRNLMIGWYREDVPDPMRIEAQMRSLSWYLPPGRGLLLRPDGIAETQLTLLTELFEID